MLYRALLPYQGWVVDADPESLNFILQHIDTIDEKGEFPDPTETADNIPIFTYTLKEQDASGPTGFEVVLNFLDAPGEFYEDIDSTSAETVKIFKASSTRNSGEIQDDDQNQDDQNQIDLNGIVDYLLSCDGIIFLLDPIRSKKDGKSYQSLLLKLFEEFKKRSQPENRIEGRLPQYMAFCLTKVDKEGIWEQLWTKVRHPDDKKEADEELMLAAKDLAKDVMGDLLFESLEHNYCVKNRYTFFPLASIGRYRDEKDKTWKEAVIDPDVSDTQSSQSAQSSQVTRYTTGFDPDAPSVGLNPTPSSTSSSIGGGGFASGNNAPKTPQSPSKPKPQINQDVKYEPFYVIEPIEWLINNFKK
ncbi:hypothetical protein BI308_20380 [Roseofilum reptotaenium AO1-A]|uniref:Uncharacterized protein n=2 Tax=Roseofilum TaxID=1233426 RepID=A0A1L9QM66_9CYAN|nr:hypothetical protein BI308_20380 [Roseofilum reptotaenium AO1-A]